MTFYALLAYAPMLAMLVMAAMTDLRARRIPNWLSFALAGSGIIAAFAGMTISPAAALFGLLVGFALPLMLFVIGALGGGDVKLLSGVGAWLGAFGVLQVFAIAALIGLVIVLTQALIHGRLAVLLRNTAVLTINLIHLRELGIEHANATGQSCRSVDRPLPYAVPVLVAVVLLMAMSARGFTL